MKPTISLAVGITALTFQVTVLYPWHKELSQDIKDLSKKIDELNKESKIRLI